MAAGTEAAGDVAGDVAPHVQGDAWSVPRPARWWGWASLVLSLVGFGVSLYLTVDHFEGAIPVCAANGVVDCAKVTTSPQSEVFGVFPVALLGLVFYTALSVVNVPSLWQLRGPAGRLLVHARLALALIGMGMVLYLLYSELFSIKAICLWCTGVHVVTFLVFLLVVATYPAMAAFSAEGR
jgi:uncharacterized membrane protein